MSIFLDLSRVLSETFSSVLSSNSSLSSGSFSDSLDLSCVFTEISSLEDEPSDDWPFVSIFLDLSQVLSKTFSRVLNSNSSLGSGSVTKTRFLILIVCLLKFLVSNTNQASEDRSFVSIFLDLSRVLSETLSSVRNSNSSLGSGSVTKTRAGFSYSLCIY